MGSRTTAPSFSSLTTQKQKEYIASMVVQDFVKPMELEAIALEMWLVAAVEGRPWKRPDKKELALIAAEKKMQEMEMKQKWLTALAIAMLYEQYAESEDEDNGQQRFDAFE